MSRFIQLLSLGSLRGRLSLLVLMVAVPGLALVAGLTKHAYDQERAAMSRHLTNTTRAVAILAERKFEAAEGLLRGLASLGALQQGDLAGFEAKVRDAVDNRREWIVVSSPEGQQLVNTRVPTGQSLPVTLLEDEFWAAMRRGERYVSNVFTGAITQMPVFSVSIPVMRDGVLRYALSFAMVPAALGDAVAAQQITSDAIVVIIDRKGVIGMRSRSPERFAGKPARPELVDAAAERPEGVIESTTLEGIPSLTAFSRCPTIGWSAAIGAPRAQLYAAAENLLKLAAVWTVLIIVLTGVGAAWIGRTVVRGMDQLVHDTTRVGAGEVPPRHPTGLREIDLVSGALRLTAEQLIARQSELQELNQTLEERVAARTRELDSVNRALVSANRELEDFARVASHDLREPLRSMTSFTDLLQEEHAPQLDVTGRAYLDRVGKSARRMSRLLEAILAYSKASAAPLAEFQLVDLNVIVAEVQQDVTQRLKETNGSIVVGALGQVRGDGRQFHQLLLNLVSNALKFHRPNVPPVVTVESTTDRHSVRLIVHDNGIGFDPEKAERIFAPFERLERTIEGSGMGLAIVRRIAERHGGSVSATSTPGVGSRFEVLLPASKGGERRET